MFEKLGLKSRPAFMPYASGGESSRVFDSEAAAVQAMGGSCRAPNSEAEAARSGSSSSAAWSTAIAAAASASAPDAGRAAAAAAPAGGCCGGGCQA